MLTLHQISTALGPDWVLQNDRHRLVYRHRSGAVYSVRKGLKDARALNTIRLAAERALQNYEERRNARTAQ